MNRLERKCLLGSAALHGLLVVILLVGSAFLKPPPQPAPVMLEIIPENALKFTDGRSSGGDPNAARTPAPKPLPEVKPLPPPPKVEKPPEPVKPREEAKPKEEEPKNVGDEPVPNKPKAKDTARKPPSRSLTNITVKVPKVDLAKQRAQEQARERAAADARAYAQQQAQFASAVSAVGRAVSGLGSSLSASAVSVQGASFGPGGGGPATANWRAAIGDIYTRAWEPPQDAADSRKAEARVTIARDGTVINFRPTPSGDPALDRSVRRVLQQVKSVPPFPDEAREEVRTVTIIFDLTVKRALG
jgi:TonB family protein